MPNFCTKCGKEIENGKAFCSACGAPVKIVENVQESNSFADSSQRDAPPQSPINQTTSNFTSSNVEQTERYDAVKTGYYFWMMFLYAIPIIGWLICIITIFVAKNKSKKNFSKAMLIWLIIGLIFSLIISLVIGWVGNKIKTYILDATGEYNIIENMQDLNVDEYLKNQTATNEVQNTTNDINNNIGIETSNSADEAITESDLESVTELLKMLQQIDKSSN